MSLNSINKPEVQLKFSHHGYIDLKGRFHDVGFRGHSSFADKCKEVSIPEGRKMEMEDYLSELGWIRISNGDIFHRVSRSINKRQENTLFSYFAYRNYCMSYLYHRYLSFEKLIKVIQKSANHIPVYQISNN